MTKDIDNEKIWCHVCKHWVRARPALVIGDNVYCQYHWNIESMVHLGFVWDWPEIYINHEEKVCL